MSSILDTSSLINTYGQTISNTNASSLQSSLGNVDKSATADELMSACKSFEAYFVQKVIEQAKQSLLENDEEDEGEYMKYFGDIMNEQYANAIVDSGTIGLAQQLYDSMKGNYGL